MFLFKKNCLTHSECFYLAIEEAKKDNPNKILIRKLLKLGEKYLNKYVDCRSTEYRFSDGTTMVKRPEPDGEAESIIACMTIASLLGKEGWEEVKR